MLLGYAALHMRVHDFTLCPRFRQEQPMGCAVGSEPPCCADMPRLARVHGI